MLSGSVLVSATFPGFSALLLRKARMLAQSKSRRPRTAPGFLTLTERMNPSFANW
jgi:hypothetical protein